MRPSDAYIVSKVTNSGSDNGLSPGQRQAIIWTNAGILLIGSLGTNLSEIVIKIHTFSFKKLCLKMSSGKWRPSCLRLNVLNLRRHTKIKMSLLMNYFPDNPKILLQVISSQSYPYSISLEICTRFCCALLCCGYAIVHNEFTWSIYPHSSGLLCWHWGNR